MVNRLQKTKVSSIYFSEPELRGQDTGLFPILLTSVNFQQLLRSVAHSKYRCCFAVDEEGHFANIITQGDVLRYSERFRTAMYPFLIFWKVRKRLSQQ